MKYCSKCQREYPIIQRFCQEDGAPLSLPDPYGLVGRTLDGKYRLDALIGIGGMGAVYSAHHLTLDRRVALKILQPNLALGDERMPELFEREAKMAAQLTHENIATVLDAGRTADKLAYIAMEWLEGPTLEEEIARCSPLSFERVAEILRRVAAALDAAHAARVIHRDLKPSNIILSRSPDGSERIKVLDFGIAKVIRDTSVSPVSAVVGTPHYASPEQLSLGRWIDGRADIYSLGVMLYQTLTGALPFNATSIHELIRMQLDAPPPPLRALRPDAPPAVEELINRLMAKNPDERPRRASDVSQLFELCLQGHYDRSATGDQETPSDAPRQAATATPFQLQRATDRSYDPALFAPTLVGRPAPVASRPNIKTVPTRHTLRRRSRVVGAPLVGLILFAAAYYLLAWPPTWPGGAIDSVAVLPFKNASADPDVEYLGAGLSESLITSLSRLPRLRVIARSSVFHYKDRDADPQAVGREMNVRAVIVGRVAQHNDNLSVDIELVDARNARRLWAERYERKLADLATMQEEIAREVAAKLRRALTGAEQRRMTTGGARDSEARQLYLKGRYYWNRRTPEDLRLGIEYFQQALEKDPQDALAYSGLADSYFALGPVGIGALPARETMPKQKAAALKALELDDTLAEAHTSLAVVKLVYDWDWAGAEQEYKRALELNPNYAIAHNWYAIFLTARGRTDEAIAESELARALDPLSVNFSDNLAGHYYYARQFDQSSAQYRKTIAANPKFAEPHVGLARVYWQQSKFEESLAELNQAIALSKRAPKLIAALGHVYAVAGKKEESLRLLRELERLAPQAEISPADFALIYLGLNDKDQAFVWLRRAYDKRDVSLIYLRVDPVYDRIRSDPRFTQLLERIG
jgi:serine/threonine-protein kinase